ncbi:MAG: hypothetical protein KJ049_06265 [Gammaproteobacteria bacterium]|jgi:hypothetical protein|nr:hypothetical protein [Gammaproteobacteria bacterium]
MVVRILIIASALASPVVFATDFGVADLESGCDSISEREIARGSLPVPLQAGDADGRLAFRGRAFDRDVTLVYMCREGSLVAGNYLLPIESLADASKSFTSVYGELVSIYGEPLFNSAPEILPALRRDPQSVPADKVRVVAQWRIGDISVSQSLMQNLPAEHGGWRVFIVVGPKRPWPRFN